MKFDNFATTQHFGWAALVDLVIVTGLIANLVLLVFVHVLSIFKANSLSYVDLSCFKKVVRRVPSQQWASS